jgi:hypothetical protein
MDALLQRLPLYPGINLKLLDRGPNAPIAALLPKAADFPSENQNPAMCETSCVFVH